MFLGFTNKKISNNHKLLSHSNLPYLVGKTYPLFFLNYTELQPSSLLENGGDQAIIKQNHLILLSFGNRWDTGGEDIIIGENPVGHCILLRYLIHDIEIKLKMYITGNIFGKIYV